MTAPVDIRALKALPTSTGAGRWLTSVALWVHRLAWRLMSPAMFSSAFAFAGSLRTTAPSGALARTARGDWLIEQTEHLEQHQ